ncbi:YqaJ viral recombinase family protein [Exiguobacterium antarcticum]|uniref:YqaJ viral recombinase family nuclease n=1 Tax=Exiguobacterium antarcticum TaxID=132920 RepID=UPI00054FDABE|nr:YqaJ viral recombinase family protein [Exiguobacterium antarcticum]
MNILVNTKDMDKNEWLEWRKKGLGGSDIAAIAGLNKYKSAMSVYLEKTGEVDIEDTAGEAAYWGTVMEDVVAKEFEARSRHKVRRKNHMIHHPEHPYLLGNLDRVLIGKKELLECKTASAYLKEEWKDDEIPAAYLIQVMHYLNITGYEAAWIAVLIGGNHFIYKRIERDDELIQYITDIASDFWNNHILKRIPPAYDGTGASSDLLKQLFPMAESDSEIELPDDADDLIDAYRFAKEREAEVKKSVLDAENRLKGMIGEAEVGIARNHLVQWKNTKPRETFDTKSFAKDQPDLYEKYVKIGKPTRRFTIKETK